MAGSRVTLERLTTVPAEAIAALLNEPRNARHLPLARGPVTVEEAAVWAAGKDAQWAAHGYGPWAVMVDGAFVGWGGFQREDDGLPDLGLVLLPSAWGRGAMIADEMLRVGFTELGFASVQVALPYSRTATDAVLARWGFVPAGETAFEGVRFRRYLLSADAWRARA